MVLCERIFPVLGLAALLLTAGCGSRKSPDEGGDGRKSAAAEAAREEVLLLGNGAEPKGLDPHVVTGVAEYNVMAALFEGLVAEDPKTLKPVPGVASSWRISADGRIYTFTLRPEALWSNGDPVTAADFVYSYRRMLSPGLAAEYAYMLYPLARAKAYNEGTLTDFSKVGVRALDEHTLELTLEHPIPYFLQLLNHYSWWPVHRGTIEKFGAIDTRDSPWTRPENFVGNGPFILVRWEIHREILVRKNPRYWDVDKVRLDGIRFFPIDSADTEERAFRDGTLHITSSVPLHRIEYYRKNKPNLLRSDPYLGTYFYRFNTRVEPLSDPRVRRALAMTIKRRQLTKFVLKGGQRPAYCFTPPNTGGYTADTAFEENDAAARKLLAEAGFPGGKGFPHLELLYNTSEQHRILAEAIQQMWKTALGIEVRLVNQEWKVYLDTVRRGDYQIARASWIGDYNDPNTFLDMWVSGGGNNRTGWSNAAYDRCIEEAAAERDPAKRFAIFRRAENILLDEMPIAPIYFYVRTMLISPVVKGWYPTLLDHHPYKAVWLEPSP